MSADRMEVNTELYGMSIDLPTVPVRVCESKPVETEPKMVVTFSSEGEAAPKAGLSWLGKMRLGLKSSN